MANNFIDSWTSKDKLYHFVGSTIMAYAIYFLLTFIGMTSGLALQAFLISVTIGVVKECIFDDYISYKDIVFDIAGSSLIFLLLLL